VTGLSRGLERTQENSQENIKFKRVKKVKDDTVARWFLLDRNKSLQRCFCVSLVTSNLIYMHLATAHICMDRLQTIKPHITHHNKREKDFLSSHDVALAVKKWFPWRPLKIRTLPFHATM
jgi:hypothetical protein